MKLKIHSAIIPLLLIVALFTGCDKEPPKPQSVIINIVTIAEETGINEQIKERTDTINQQVSEEMKALSEKLRNEFEAEKAGFGENPSDEDAKKIKALRDQQGKQNIEARNEINARRTEEVADIRQAYLDEIMSVAREVALAHGASIVLKAVSVFWSEGSVDITDEVIRRMSEATGLQPAGSEQELDVPVTGSRPAPE